MADIVKPDEQLVGKAIRQKKNPLSEFVGQFFAQSIHEVKDYLWKDVFIPNVKKTIHDLAISGLDMAIYGESAPISSSSNASKYSMAYQQQKQRQMQSVSAVKRGYSYDSLIVSSKAEGERLLFKLNDILADVGSVTVADMYDLVGEVHNYTDNKWGWTNLAGAKVTLSREGYLLKMPEPQPLT